MKRTPDAGPSAPSGSSRDVDAYVAAFPPEVRQALNAVRQAIRKAAPDAAEKLAYGIPTFVLNGNLVHFGGFRHHIGFYPTPSAIEAFRAELSRYEGAKGSVRFPLEEPMPLRLVERIVRFRVKEAREKRAGEAKGAAGRARGSPRRGSR